MLTEESYRKLSIWGGLALVVLAFVSLVGQDLSLSLGRRRALFTVRELEAISSALSAYRRDHEGRSPSVADGGAEQLEPFLVPTYLSSLPREDGWGRALRVGRPDPRRFEDPRMQSLLWRGSAFVVWSRGPNGRDDARWLGGVTFEFQPGRRMDVWGPGVDDVVLFGGEIVQGPRVSEDGPEYASDPLAVSWLRLRLPRPPEAVTRVLRR